MPAARTYPPPLVLEEQALHELLSVLPADWQFVAVNCELSDDPAQPQASLVSVYLGQDATGEWRAQPLPALPPAFTARLVDLREALAQFAPERWRSTELHLEGDGSYQFTYSYEPLLRLRGLTAAGDAASRFEPAAFLARFLAAQAAPAASGADYDYSPSGRGDYPAARPAAPPVWVCTWCHAEYASARQPTSFQPGKCPRNPGHAHAWHPQ